MYHILMDKCINLSEFFRRLVQQSIVNLHIQATDVAEFYLVNLLTDFSKTDSLYEPIDGKHDHVPLALLMERAIHADQMTRIKTLKYIGDMALFISGVFPAYIQRFAVDADYYIGMGGGAYLTLSRCVDKAPTFGPLYEELGQHFGQFVKLVNAVVDQARGYSPMDLLKLYDQWMQTKDKRIGEILNREGIATTSDSIIKQ